jgi:hypothetical protein
MTHIESVPLSKFPQIVGQLIGIGTLAPSRMTGMSRLSAAAISTRRNRWDAACISKQSQPEPIQMSQTFS